MTRTTPLRRTMRQFSQMRRTELRTFMMSLFFFLCQKERILNHIPPKKARGYLKVFKNFSKSAKKAQISVNNALRSRKASPRRPSVRSDGPRSTPRGSTRLAAVRKRCRRSLSNRLLINIKCCILHPYTHRLRRPPVRLGYFSRENASNVMCVRMKDATFDIDAAH